MSYLKEIFDDPQNISGVFCKLLTSNDDSGRHGIVVPVDAYGLLPVMKAKNSGHSHVLNGTFKVWKGHNPQSAPISINYKYYLQQSHSNPERRLTNFRSQALNRSSPKDLFILARKKNTYESHFIPAGHKLYAKLIKELALNRTPQGAFTITLDWKPSGKFTVSAELKELLKKFDNLGATYHQTVNPSSQGVGITLEQKFGIKANNSPLPDYKGIEIKAYKMKGGGDPYDQDLFLKQPKWLKGGASGNPATTREILTRYGYTDEHKRKALKVKLSNTKNKQKLILGVDSVNKEILIKHNNTVIGYWTFKTIKDRLIEKHKHVVFIGALARKKGAQEEFQYKVFTYCGSPSPKAFAKMITEGKIKVDLRMHDDGKKIRNHGTQFRIRATCLRDLYSKHQNLR